MPEDTPETAESTKPVSPAERLRAYRWPKGVSGNPGGRPKADPLTKAKRLARESLTEALATAVAIMRTSSDEDVKLKAAAFVYKLAEEARAASSPSEPASERMIDVNPDVKRLSSEALARLAALPPGGGGSADRYSPLSRGARSAAETEADSQSQGAPDHG